VKILIEIREERFYYFAGAITKVLTTADYQCRRHRDAIRRHCRVTERLLMKAPKYVSV
jgi:hypothetical protein